MNAHRQVYTPEPLPRSHKQPLIAFCAVLAFLAFAGAWNELFPEPTPRAATPAPTADAIAQARIEGFRAGIQLASEHGCRQPVALSAPIGNRP